MQERKLITSRGAQVHVTPGIRRAVPNELWQLVVEFDEPYGFRLFEAILAREEKGFSFLAYPQHFKNLTFDAAGVYWGRKGSLDAAYLLKRSRPISGDELRRQWLRVAYKNQAPTTEHPTHHVYEVAIRPFDGDEPFSLTESIAGGFMDLGGWRAFSLEAMITDPEWRRHFVLSGCEWAIEVVERGYPDQGHVVGMLVTEVCRRAGEEGTAQKGRT